MDRFVNLSILSTSYIGNSCVLKLFNKGRDSSQCSFNIVELWGACWFSHSDALTAVCGLEYIFCVANP